VLSKIVKGLTFWEGIVGVKSIVLRIALITLISMILFAACLRLVHLDADFPTGLNWSSDLYTDEGWYSGNAIAWALTGHWYIPGDFNSMITLPFFQWLQMGVFGLFGVNLVSARISVAFFSLLSLVLVFLLARRYAGDLAGWITLGLLSTDYAFFAYSRIALMEIPFTALCLASIWAAGATNLPAWLGMGLSAVLLCAAVLTKTSALPLLLVVLYALWLRLPGEGVFPVLNWRRRLFQCMAFLALFILLIGGETFFAIRRFGAEYFYLTTTNVTLLPPHSVSSMLYTFARILWNGLRVDPLLLIASFSLVAVVLTSGIGTKVNRLIVLSTIWIGVNVIYLGLRTYLPPRYFVPLIVSMIFLIAGAMTTLLNGFRGERITWLFVSLVALIGIINFVQVIRYMGELQYTFRDAGLDISHRIRKISFNQPVYMVGNLADSLSLLTDIPAINTKLGFEDLNWRLASYHPRFYVSLGVDSREQQRLKKQYSLREIASYQVFGNYYHGKSIYLFQLIDLPNPN
jgi:4-amino-4-deoxy-L-arabinose transferase-like glycosyltransferase